MILESRHFLPAGLETAILPGGKWRLIWQGEKPSTDLLSSLRNFPESWEEVDAYDEFGKEIRNYFVLLDDKFYIKYFAKIRRTRSNWYVSSSFRRQGVHIPEKESKQWEFVTHELSISPFVSSLFMSARGIALAQKLGYNRIEVISPICALYSIGRGDEVITTTGKLNLRQHKVTVHPFVDGNVPLSLSALNISDIVTFLLDNEIITSHDMRPAQFLEGFDLDGKKVLYCLDLEGWRWKSTKQISQSG